MSEENLTRIHLNGKEYILIGTAHVSKKSAEEVKAVIELERPDSVCIELDEQRYKSIIDGAKWKETDIFTIIKKKKTTLLLMNLVISSFQKRLANQFGIKPGQEMIQGIESAEAVGAHLVLADRDIQITFARIWSGLGFWDKTKLLATIVTSIFNKESISEEELENIKSKDMLNAMLSEFTAAFPRLKVPLIDERDQYLAQKIKEAPGSKVVAVLGAAHIPGITEEIYKEQDLAALTQLPPKSLMPIIIGWSIPLILLGLIGYTLFTNPAAGMAQIISWVLWNGSLAAVGAAIAFAHPIAILTAFIVAPISSLNPLMAAGWFSGIVQAYYQRPNVGDFENLTDDVYTAKGFWSNKVTRILLVVMLTNLGSTAGTFAGGADVIRLFIEHVN